MPKRKNNAGEDVEGDLHVPLPIQTFFWRQTSPFIRPKLGKQCDASCVSFERVVVQNILHGQPPSLCKAIQSVSRWKLIQVAFPHVMHACSALLANRKQYNPDGKFSNSETKLLYTLHWIILDAASECEDTATLQEEPRPGNSVQLHSLQTVQLFVYLLAPLVHTLEESDFCSLKLENGLRLWQPLWDHRQPDIPCFSTPVKPPRNVLKAQRSLLKVNTNAANIYIGKGTSRENLHLFLSNNASRRSSDVSEESISGLAPLARMSDICALSASTQSVSVVCEFCNNMFQLKTGEALGTCRCGRKDSFVAITAETKSLLEKLGTSVDKDFTKQRLASAAASGMKGATSTSPDILSASYFDVAVLQCLFCVQWSEDGILWALRYMHQRLLEICDERVRLGYSERERSQSLPFSEQLMRSYSIPPPVGRSDRAGGSKMTNPVIGNQKFASVSPGLSTIPSDPEIQPHPTSPSNRSGHGPGYRREPPYKKVCLVEVRQYPDSSRAVVRKKEPAKTDDFGRKSATPFKTKLDQYSLPKVQRDSATGLYKWTLGHPSSGPETTPEKEKGLSWAMDDDDAFHSSKFGMHSDRDSESSSQHSSHDSSNSSQLGESSSSAGGFGSKPRTASRQPIITITQETPKKIESDWTPSSNLANSPESGEGHGVYDGAGGTYLSRSMTDSQINYQPEEEVHEVAGSVHYIQKNGHLNYKVILQALHFVAKNQGGEQICEVLLNLLNCLLDVDIVERKSDVDQRKKEEEKKMEGKTEEEVKEEVPEGKQEITAFGLAMDSLISIYKSLGCPNGCGDGLRGRHGDHLRHKGQMCLQRLQRANPPMFRSYMRESIKKRPIQEMVDFFHAFIGFCVDPALLQQASHDKQQASSGQQDSLARRKAVKFSEKSGAVRSSPASVRSRTTGVRFKTRDVSPSSGVSSGSEGHRKSVSQEALSHGGFTNNFGHSIGGVGYRGVEGVLISNSMKTFVTKCVESTKELYSSDNISLFCDVRQLITYFKEIHGGTFRRIALSGLLDSYFDVKKKEEKTAKEKEPAPAIPICRTTSVTSESGDEKDQSKSTVVDSDSAEYGKSRKSLFKKKLKKPLVLQQYAAASDSEVLEELLNKRSPRCSLSAAEDDSPSGTNTPKRKFSKFHIGGWRKNPKSDHEEDSPSEPGTLDRRESKSETHFHRTGVKGKMSFKTASQATLTFLSARKRIEGGLKQLGKKMSKHDLTKDIKMSQAEPTEDTDGEQLIVREKKLVDKYIIKSGMLRFNFLLECCHPGTVPDAQLVASMLQLDAPVSARATLLLECAHFVHRCNKGDWPNWMRLNLPSFRHSSSALQSRGQPSGIRRTLILQKAAGRMFYSWAENLGSQLEYIMAKEHADRLDIVSDIHDERKKRQLRIEDDEEDFLDEATVNPNGNDCPYALKMLACLVLQEVTTFLRETFQYLPRSKKQKLDPGWDKHLTSRRWSSIVSSPGHSEKSSESNIVDMPQSSSTNVMGSPGERKISFAVQMERSDSLNSSTTSLSMDPLVPPHTPVEERKGRRLAQGRQKLLKHLRRGSTHNSSFRQNRSFRIRRQQDGGSIKLYGSIRSRKVSSQSLQSQEKFVDGEPSSEDLESMTMFSEEMPEVAEEQQELDDEKLYMNMPWLRVVIQLANLSNFICQHQGFCHPNCYERHRRSCSRLVTSVKKVYESTEQEEKKESEKKLEARRDMLKERLKRRAHSESIFQQSSPTRRRESTPLLEKIKTDVNLVKQKLGNWKKGDKPKETKEDAPIVKYIVSQAQRLTQCPMGILAKAAPVLTEDNFIDIMPVAWELMLEVDQELAAAAACVFLLSSVKAPEKAQAMIFKELQHEDTNQRINAVLRFGALWRFRHQVWPRMEDGVSLNFRVPPPGIDFTLPSPTIGLPSQVPVDPPWIPHFKTKIEEVTVNQDQTKSLVTATTTRRKQQQEMIQKALLREEERKRIDRETFPLTTVSVTQLAAVEPSMHHVSEDHEEALQEEISLAARRVSLAPNRANLHSRSLSWRNGSMHWARLTTFEGDEERLDHAHHVHLAQTFFPSSICAVVLPIIHLLEDRDVNLEGMAVSEVAEKVIWNCLVEDPVLFLRHFLEKLTHKDKHEELMFLLRKMVLHYRKLPSNMARSLFNYLIGYVMFYVRTPQSHGQEAIASALALLFQIIPSVEGINFKVLKQTLKKEQCDPNILVSANVPSAKKIIVHGPDLTSIPSQFPIHEDTQFNQILQDSLEFFNIPEDQQDTYFLVDTKSNQIHNLNCYVRDFYFFRRNFYPQLSLVHMNPEEASENLQKQAVVLKFGEIGKVLFTMAVLQGTPPNLLQNHISFLHEELTKLPAFPRKALDADFSLYNGSLGKELYGLDTLHKYSWVKLVYTMFCSMDSTFNWSNDLLLFLNVINGCIILHCEDTALLRYCLAVLINICRHFKHIFSMNGFLYVMPTLLKVYSNNQPNPVLCQAIHFICRQFYILHRKPFMLQMFGSVASMLDLTSAVTGMLDCSKVQPDCFFKLLLSLEQDCSDSLSVFDLVEGEKPLRALDFCYESDPDTFNIIDVINMCVTVIAYAPDSFRSVQMLTILEVVLPRYLEYQKKETIRKDNPTAARAEINTVSNIGVSIRALINCCELFTRNMSVPIRQLESDKTDKKDKNRGSPVETSVFYDEREDSHARHMEEGRGRKQYYDQDDEDTQMRNEFRKPRDCLLNVVAEFYSTCQPRLRELRKVLADPSFRPPEMLDHKSHNRLAEIAHTLLKLAPYDPETMACAGLQRYVTEILPITDWSQEAVRPALNLVLRRLDRLFSKISKKTSLKRKCDWDAAANLLKGVYLALKKFQYIAHLPHLKALINVLISIVLSGGSGGQSVLETFTGVHRSSEHGAFICVPPAFSSALVKLVAMQMQALGDQFSLEQICGGMSVFPSSDRCINMLVNFILPLCIRVGCGRRDTPKLRQMDINYALTVILNVLSPPAKTSGSQQNSTKSNMHHLSISEHGRCSSFSQGNKNQKQHVGNELLIHTAYLGLEILMTCFDKALSPEWHRVARCIHDLGRRGKVCLPMWKFLDFVTTHRPSIFLLLQPFIQFKMMRVNCDTAQEYYLQQTIKDKLQGYSFTHPKCTGSILVELAVELRQIKEEFLSSGGEYRSRTTTMATERSDFSQTHILDHRAKASATEVTADIIGPPKPTLATIGKRASRATIFSQTSSNNSAAPFKTTVVTSSVDSGSPVDQQKTSRRISAKDGTRILEKFKKPTQDDLSPADQAGMGSPPKVHRQPTICFREPSTRQSSTEDGHPADILYENEAEFPNGGEVIRTTLVGTGLGESPDLNPKEHRLQRQDAKSRKTFKIKRQKTKTTSMRRFISTRRHGGNHSDTESNSTDGSPTQSIPRHKKPMPEQVMLHLHRTGTGTQSPRSGSTLAKSVETVPEAVEEPSRPRYIQRSKSHDDPHADFHAPAGTVRGRIARQGAKIVRSRSPSSSPVRDPKSPPPLSSPLSSPIDVPADLPGIVGAGSPPMSAQSLQGDTPLFSYSTHDSLKKRRDAKRYKHTSPPDAWATDRYPGDPGMSPEGRRSHYRKHGLPPTGRSSPLPVTSPDGSVDSADSQTRYRARPVSSPESPLSPSDDGWYGTQTPPDRTGRRKLSGHDPQASAPTRAFSPPVKGSAGVGFSYSAGVTSPFRALSPPPSKNGREAFVYNKPVPSTVRAVTPPPKMYGSAGYTQQVHAISPPPGGHERDRFVFGPRIASPPPAISPPPAAGQSGSRRRSSTRSPPPARTVSPPPARVTSPAHIRPSTFSMVNPPGRSGILHSPTTPPPTGGSHGDRERPTSEGFSQAYVSSRCSSDESLTEQSTLLKDDEKSNSRGSVCIYFDGRTFPDTLV